MTIAACPQGCGGVVDTGKDEWCSSCRRYLNETRIPNPDWCWVWWGPPHHRMRCRLPKGHEGAHDTHEVRENIISVSVSGETVQ